jgi:hypothetical protein
MEVEIQVWRCPVHGLIESPRRFALYEPHEPAEMICPINLSTDESGITDDLCEQTCEGPLVVVAIQPDGAGAGAGG